MSTYGTLAPETVRLAEDVREWALREVRPFAKEADRIHDVPELAWGAITSCPVGGNPVGGYLEYQDSVDLAKIDTRFVVATAVTESLLYGDVLSLEMLIRGRGLASKVVDMIGTPDQVERWILPLQRGEYNEMAFAMTEPSGGSDPAGMQTTATRTDTGWIINGHKMYCSGGAIADLLLVFASIDRSLGYKGIRAFVIPRKAAGVAVVKANESKLGMRSMMTSTLAFENVELPYDALVGGDSDSPVDGLKAGLSALNGSRGFMAAVCTGIAQAAIDEGRKHLAGEKSAIAPHRWSVIESEFERMEHVLDGLRHVAYRFARLVDSKAPHGREAAMAKAYAPPIAERVILRVLQHMGSTGYSEGNLVEKWHRDIKILDIFEGTGNIQRIVLGRHLRNSV